MGFGLVYLVLEVGAICGVPMSPDEIERLMSINRPAVVQVEQTAGGDGDDPPPLRL
jgi:hypothetical protein